MLTKTPLISTWISWILGYKVLWWEWMVLFKPITGWWIRIILIQARIKGEASLKLLSRLLKTILGISMPIKTTFSQIMTSWKKLSWMNYLQKRLRTLLFKTLISQMIEANRMTISSLKTSQPGLSSIRGLNLIWTTIQTSPQRAVWLKGVILRRTSLGKIKKHL